MASKRKHHFLSSIINFVLIVPSLLNIFSRLSALIKAEATLAIRKIFYLVMLLIFVFMFALSMWACLQMILFTYFVNLQFSMLQSLSMILLINFVLLVFIFYLISRVKSHLFFPVTRELFGRRE